MSTRGSVENRQLVSAYAKRKISLCYGIQTSFVVDGYKIKFLLRPDEKGGSILRVSIDAKRPEELVMLIKGLSPCKDTAFRPHGSFERRLPPGMYQLMTRLAILNPNKRRRAYLRDQRLAEAAAID